MKTYVIYSSETVYYETQIEAESEEQAKEKFWDMDHNNETLQTCDSDNWTLDEVREVK